MEEIPIFQIKQSGFEFNVRYFFIFSFLSLLILWLNFFFIFSHYFEFIILILRIMFKAVPDEFLENVKLVPHNFN